MTLELKKRIITSFFLLVLLYLMYFYTFILIISVIIISIISWIEFNGLIFKIFQKNKNKDKLLRFCYKAISLMYFMLLIYLVLLIKSQKPDFQIFIIFSILVSVMSDVGGLVVGKTFKGRKLTKISPNKTVSGSIGSFIFSLFLIPIFLEYLKSFDLLTLSIITLIISLTSQLGDLFISFLKRKARVKNTSDLLPGHGGILDRIDGIIFALPIGFLILVSFKI
jgi:phosphatidate cytidylyltransferase